MGLSALLSKLSCLLFIFILFTGCESIPFQKTAEEPYSAVDPAYVKERFRSSIPQHMRLLNTIVFEYNWKTFSGIGFVDVNIPERTSSLACINQMGMKLFEISIDKENINTIFALPDFTSKGDFAKMVGEDIRRIYFDLVPSENAEIIREKHAVIFNQKDGEGITEYIFSGPGHYLTDKTYYEDGNPLWRVSFYEYQSKYSRIYPGGTILKNYKYDYRLIIRLKEISD